MKTLFLLLFIPIVFSYSFAQEPEILSPRMQIFEGVATEKVVCKDGLELIFKSYNGNPLCVKPETAKILLERDMEYGIGWATKLATTDIINPNVGWVASYCDTVGGWIHMPHPGVDWIGPICDTPTADAGKDCSDSSQCESWCAAQLTEAVEIGSPVSGKCAGGYEWSCISRVSNGTYAGTMCK